MKRKEVAIMDGSNGKSEAVADVIKAIQACPVLSLAEFDSSTSMRELYSMRRFSAIIDYSDASKSFMVYQTNDRMDGILYGSTCNTGRNYRSSERCFEMICRLISMTLNNCGVVAETTSQILHRCNYNLNPFDGFGYK